MTTFAGTGSNQITLSGHRTRCRIANAGAPSASTADVTIFGMDQSIMNQLATLGILVNQVSQNTILVSAGSAQNNQASAGNASISTAPSGFPVVFGFVVYESFMGIGSDGIAPMPQPGESPVGGHCVYMLGYDLATRRVKCRNSWGQSWGAQGDFYLPVEYVSNPNLASDFWMIRRTGPAPGPVNTA